jgi:hypothetical protein
MVILVKRTNQKNHVSFMLHAFNQSEHPFGQCKHLIKLNLLKSHGVLYVVENNET